MGVKHPLRTVKRYKTQETRGAEKCLKKAGRQEEETEMARENMVTENRFRCENIGSVFYSSIKPRVLNHIYHSWTFCQLRGERKERGEKGMKGRGEQDRKCIRPMGVKHSFRTIKRYKTHETRGGWKSFQKSRKRGRRDRNGQRKHGNREQIEMWEYRICVLFKYLTPGIKPYLSYCWSRFLLTRTKVDLTLTWQFRPSWATNFFRVTHLLHLTSGLTAVQWRQKRVINVT